MKRDADALFTQKQVGDFLPRLAPWAQLADEIVVRFQNAVERFAAAFLMCRFSHHRTVEHGAEKRWKRAGES